MLLDTIFAPFVKERPICVMARAVLERLLDAQRLDALFARTAERQYTRELLFSVVLENSNVAQLASNRYLSVHPLPQEDPHDTDDASAAEIYPILVSESTVYVL
jgi:hypothetical protein